MKYLKILIIIVIAIFFANGCTDDFEEINTNPLVLTAEKVDVSLIGKAFAQAEYNGVYEVDWRFQVAQNLFADLYCQYYATTASYFSSDRYIQVGSWASTAWGSFYSRAATNIKLVEDAALKNNLPIHNAIINIWKVYAYHRITDYWGPIVYSSFGNGETYVPYDQQEEIYRSFFTTLDEAMAVLKSNTGGNAYGSNDLIYSGDVNKWIKFGASLRLRLAMRVKYVDPDLAKKQAEQAISEGVIESNDDNAFVATFLASPNPINSITAWGEYRMSAAMESVLKGYDDPRLPEYFSPSKTSVDAGTPSYEGLINGQAKVDMGPSLNTDYSDLGPRFLPAAMSENWPIPVMRAAEVYLLRAEGALEGWSMGGTVKDLYEKGIEMSITEYTSVDQTTIDAYIASANTPVPPGDKWGTPALSDIPVAFESGGTKERQLEQIITQKWIALYPDGWEAWAELRRTGYPKVYARLHSDNPNVPADEVMRRMVFVELEFNTNKKAVEEAVASPEISGDNTGLHKVWWDKK